MIRSIRRRIRTRLEPLAWSPRVRALVAGDRGGLPERDPGETAVRDACLAWLCRAQDRSASADGGVARHFALLEGWSTSYPETTGYIVPTMLDEADDRDDDELRARAARMLDWLVSIQFPDGSFQGGRIDSVPVVPVTFNTGQILLGLAAGASRLGDRYREPMRRAADWLTATQDDDGCWRRHPSPFTEPGEKAYDTHVAWGLLEAARVEDDDAWRASALRNIRWAVTKQRDDGWVESNCLDGPEQPLTHTIGYFLRGVVEGWRTSRDPALLEAARKTADGLASSITPDGFLPGRLGPAWTPTVDWACLTGTVQVACCWLLLDHETGQDRYREAARSANRYVRRAVRFLDDPDLHGGVTGSFPVDGDYGRLECIAWGNKFLLDAQRLERRLLSSEPG